MNGNNYFPPNGNVGDCGFFLAFPEHAGQPEALKKTTWGFNGAAGPHGLSLYTSIEPQSPVTGNGSEATPYEETTKFAVKDSKGVEDARITELTKYVSGTNQFVSSYTVKNMTLAPLYFRAIYAGDLFVNGNDVGTGSFLGGPPPFIGGLNTGSGILGGFVQAPEPSPAWNWYQELDYPEVWTRIENSVEEEHVWNDTIEPNEVDNAAGVEWDQYRALGLAAGGEATFSIINRTQVPSNLQISPANQTLTQNQTATISVTALDLANQPYAGKTVHYNVSGSNPQSGTFTLDGSGKGQISYVGHNAGQDTTQLWVDISGTGSQTSGDPSGTAVVTWLPLPPPPPPGPPAPNSTYKVQSIKANPNGTITITFVPTQAGTGTLEVTVPTGSIARRRALEAKKHKCKKGQSFIKGKCRPTTTLSGKVSKPGAAGVPLTITVKPSKAITKALKKGRTVVLTAKLTYRSALGGLPTVQTFRKTIKPQKKKHH